MLVKVENTTYSKDSNTGNIVNNDVSGYNARKRVINRNKKQDNRIAELENTISKMSVILNQLVEDKHT